MRSHQRWRSAENAGEWRGPSMLPQFGEALGKAVKGARDTMDRDSAESKPVDDDQATGK